MKAILSEIKRLEKKAVSFENYRREHPNTKKTRSDRLFDDHQKNHPNSKISYEDFKSLRNRESVDTLRVKGKPVHTQKTGATAVDKESLHHHLKRGSFSMLSAENAHAKKMTPEENAARTERLKKKLTDMGAIFHEGKGHFFGNDENSFMVHHTKNVSPAMIEDLGREFEQHSVIHSTDGHHHLKPLHEKDAKDEMKGSGFVSGKHLKKIYTEFPNTSKLKMRLSSHKPKYHDENGYFEFEHDGDETTHFKLNLK
jgi:hypothetical protein